MSGQRVGIIAATDVLDGSLQAAWTAGVDKPGLASAKDSREERLVEQVLATRSSVDTLVVYLHMGRETETCPNARQVALADTLHEAGADIVIGSHAHRLQGAGYRDGRFVAYGLGNYIFSAPTEVGRRTATLLVDVTGRRVDWFRWEPARIENFVPVPQTGQGAELSLAELGQLGECAGLSATAPATPDQETG